MKRKTEQELEKLTKQHVELEKLIDDKNVDSSKINSDLEKPTRKYWTLKHNLKTYQRT